MELDADVEVASIEVPDCGFAGHAIGIFSFGSYAAGFYAVQRYVKTAADGTTD